ncbi:LysM peptidoglycan-binding domain-containing protein, partial [Myxococcota bacterium]|nr:LysM peptidoglycan-binding domain-containing protein [Myxococcota bacterium]
MVPETTRHSPIKRGHILTLITMSLFLWAACARESVPVTTAPRPPRQNRMYQVRGTETLSSIASRFAVKGGYHALIALNGLNAKGSIHEGQLLRIPHRVGRTDNLRPLPVIKQGLPKLLPCGKLLALPTKMLLPDGVSRHCVKVGADSFVCKEPGESADTYEIRFRKGTKSVLLLG